jgi:hypothetical protein
MKKCAHCGQVQGDAVTTRCECGSSQVPARSRPASEDESRKLEPDEIPLPPIAQRNNRGMALRCRTPGEAYLICNELEKEDILCILPEDEELLSQFKRNGYVELAVSAKAYESLADLRSTVEFQYKRLRSEQPLLCIAKLAAVGCGIMPMPGAFVFAWLLANYRRHGYDRQARDFKFWFFFGLGVWLLSTATVVVLTS